jgi:hypothetical protein
MRLPILELLMVASLFVAARMSGDGFAQTVEGYDSYVHGEPFGSRSGSHAQVECHAGDEDLIKSWDDQFEALKNSRAVVQASPPTLQSIVASLAGEVL